MRKNNVEQICLPFVDGDVVIHCFFRCPYIVRSVDPQAAHDLMELHYAEKHTHQIDRIVARYRRW